MADNIPPPPINTLPRGLLDFLGIQSMGANPRNLAQLVQPIIDMMPFYLAQEEEYFRLVRATTIPVGSAIGTLWQWSSTAPVDIINGAAGLIVPNNEIWYVSEMTACVALSNAANDFFIPQLTLLPAGGNGQFLPQTMYGMQPVLGTSPGQIAGAQLARPFWAGPGSTLMVQSGGYVFSAITTLLGSMKVVRLKI